MKVHIAKRNDTFESIAQQYGISLQDLIGMNTHINYLAGLVPGLKIKLPDINRKDGLSFQEKLQTHFPKVDTGAVDIHTGSSAQGEQPVEETATVETEEAIPVPLTPIDTAVADGVKVDIPSPHINPVQTVDFPEPANSFQSAQGNGFQATQGNSFQTAQGNGFQTAQGNGFQSAQGNGFQSAQGNSFQAAQGNGFQTAQGNGFQTTQGTSAQPVASGFQDSASTNFGTFANDESNWNTTPGEQVGIQGQEGGITVNQSPYQHAHLDSQATQFQNFQAPTPGQVQTYPGTSHLGEPAMITHYPVGWQDAYTQAQVGAYYDRPPMGNAYSTFIPGPATIIYHGYEPRGWELRQEPLPYAPYPDFSEIPVIYPGGYGYPTRTNSLNPMAMPPTPCSGGFTQADYLSFYYPDEASYWAAFPWGV